MYKEDTINFGDEEVGDVFVTLFFKENYLKSINIRSISIFFKISIGGSIKNNFLNLYTSDYSIVDRVINTLDKDSVEAIVHNGID